MTEKAPFDPDIVQRRNYVQRHGMFHPYTCAHNGRADHREGGVLVATVRGWICPYCDYTQDWAHATPTELKADP